MRAAIGINLLVDNYDEALRFYCATLGLFRVMGEPGLARTAGVLRLRFHDPRFPFTLYVTLARTAQERAVVGNQSGDNIFLSFPVEDCELLFHQLVAAGVHPGEEILDLPYGRQLTVLDPFGNRISFFQDYEE
jgi:catechol 2,3-dioxygenase-like lactoylglutathione lyase family enzyme